MRRLPAARMLPRMLACGTATPADAEALGDLLAGFYRDAIRAPWNGVGYHHRLRNTVIADAGELDAAVRPLTAQRYRPRGEPRQAAGE